MRIIETRESIEKQMQTGTNEGDEANWSRIEKKT